ncbi:MAG: SDR family NAD(P)-dependent oxidoreductase [Rhodospirillales bacterium]|nr:SDR family NAD(P)-dependent oxidoreductase [Rhodospirillales bacterium]
MSFEGKVAIVTGASPGIGATLAEELARRGAHVACVARARSIGKHLQSGQQGTDPASGRGTAIEL